jgi:hypothetical protein
MPGNTYKIQQRRGGPICVLKSIEVLGRKIKYLCLIFWTTGQAHENQQVNFVHDRQVEIQFGENLPPLTTDFTNVFLSLSTYSFAETLASPNASFRARLSFFLARK